MDELFVVWHKAIIQSINQICACVCIDESVVSGLFSPLSNSVAFCSTGDSSMLRRHNNTSDGGNSGLIHGTALHCQVCVRAAPCMLTPCWLQGFRVRIPPRGPVFNVCESYIFGAILIGCVVFTVAMQLSFFVCWVGGSTMLEHWTLE